MKALHELSRSYEPINSNSEQQQHRYKSVGREKRSIQLAEIIGLDQRVFVDQQYADENHSSEGDSAQ
jgi:hypothetical protein